MKINNKIFSFLIVSFLFSSLLFSQDRDMGDDPERCRMNLSTYTEFFNQGNIRDAYPAWQWCFHNCPASTRNLYIHGVDIMEHFIENAEDDETREAYIDTLMMVFDNRIEYFGQEATVLRRKATAMLRHRPTEVVEVKNILKRVYELMGNETPPATIGTYKNVVVVLYANDLYDGENLVNLYLELTEVLDYQLEDAEGNDKERIKNVKERVEELFVNSGAADCHTIIRIFTPQLENDPKNVELAEKIVMLLDRGSSDECQLDDLYLNAAEVLYNNEQTVLAAHALAQSYFKRNEPQRAKRFYKEAIDMAEENRRKADLQYELALLNFSQLEQYRTARDLSLQALSNNPELGRAHMLIARAYAAGARDCGETVIERKALWWVVVDRLNRAKRIDPNLAEDADRLINRYTQNFPTQEEGFWENVSEGESFTVGCWVNETTTVRFHN